MQDIRDKGSTALAEAEQFLLSLPPAVMLEPGAHPLIVQSYLMASELHRDQKRKGGEPYFTHPLAVVKILCDVYPAVDMEMICAALLHDTVEDCGITTEEIAQKTTPKIAELVDGLTKITTSDGHSDQEKTFAKLKDFSGRDIRVAFIKFSDVLHNMEHLENLPDAQRKKFVTRALTKYVPWARSLHQDRIADLIEKKAGNGE